MSICVYVNITLDWIEEELLLQKWYVLLISVSIAKLISIEMPAYTFLYLFSDGLIFANLRCEKNGIL